MQLTPSLPPPSSVQIPNFTKDHRRLLHQKIVFNYVITVRIDAFSALTPLVGWQEGQPAC